MQLSSALLAWSLAICCLLFNPFALAPDALAQDALAQDTQAQDGIANEDAQLVTDQQQQAIAISRTLSCPVCQGATVYESASPIAKAMRLQVNQLVLEEKTEAEIHQWFRDRYGDESVRVPVRNWANSPLWLIPLLALLLAVALVYRAFRREIPQS